MHYNTKLDPELEELGRKIIHAAYLVHKNLGPGLLERIYEVCLCHELKKMGVFTERQVYLPIIYDGIRFDEGFKLDVLVEKKIICELKAQETYQPVWSAQIISHLHLTDLSLGYLINFNVPVIKEGIKRFINT